MTNITIRQIQSFLQVAQLGSFTRAAQRLNVAQPALSQQIRDLEAELGIRLFDRTTRRVELTDGGREFERSAAKILDDLDRAARDAHGLANKERGRIIVAAPPLLSAIVLPTAIADFRSKYPGIQIVLVDAATDQIANKVRSGEVDCGLGTFRNGEDGLATTALARDRLMVFCAKDHPLADMDSVRWQNLSPFPIITLTKESGIRLLVEVGFESAKQPFAPAYEVSFVTTVLAMLEAKLGISILPTYAWAAARGRGISAAPLIEPTIARDIVTITRAGRSVSPGVSTFARFLSKHTIAMLPIEEARDTPKPRRSSRSNR
jgi:DNA-binding transcriptional LysR family regulator